MVIQVHRLQLSAGKTDDGAELCWAGRARVGVVLGRRQIDADGGWHACDWSGHRRRCLCLDCRHAVVWFHVRLRLRLAVVGALSPLQLLRCAGQAQMPLVQQRGGRRALDARGVRRQHLRGLSCCIGGSERQRPLHHRRARRRRGLSSHFACDWSPCRSRHGISVAFHGLVSIAPGAARNSQP